MSQKTVRYNPCEINVKKCTCFINSGSVVVNFLSQLIFIFRLFLGMAMYANDFETKEKQKLPEIKKLTAREVLTQLFCV